MEKTLKVYLQEFDNIVCRKDNNEAQIDNRGPTQRFFCSQFHEHFRGNFPANSFSAKKV